MPLVSDQVTVTFAPSGVTNTVNRGRRLLTVIREAKLPIGYSCRGQGVCTACAVRVIGDLEPANLQETKLIERIEDHAPNQDGAIRIACLARVDSDLTVRADYW
tara:strand:- start:254 stop:565 length:312 start_codon:yes stop_codon:yes gene_type:complete